MRAKRYEQSDLNALALTRAHPFQKIAIEELMRRKWRVNLISSRDNVTVIVMRHDR